MCGKRGGSGVSEENSKASDETAKAVEEMTGVAGERARG